MQHAYITTSEYHRANPEIIKGRIQKIRLNFIIIQGKSKQCIL